MRIAYSFILSVVLFAVLLAVSFITSAMPPAWAVAALMIVAFIGIGFILFDNKVNTPLTIQNCKVMLFLGQCGCVIYAVSNLVAAV